MTTLRRAPIEEAIRITTEETPLATRCTGLTAPLYVLEFEDDGVSVRLTEAQARGLVARILRTMLDDYEG